MALKNFLGLCVVCMMAAVGYGQGWDALGLAGKAVNPPPPKFPGDLTGGFDIGKVRVVPEIKGFASGNNGNNYNAYGSVGLGAKVWESNNGRHQIGVGVSANKAQGSHQGIDWKTKTNYGGGLHYQWNFGR